MQNESISHSILININQLIRIIIYYDRIKVRTNSYGSRIIIHLRKTEKTNKAYINIYIFIKENMKCYTFDILKNCKSISSDFEQKYTNKIK